MNSPANTIFVQMASYRDPQLIPTLNNMLDNAKFPENLHITVCWQHGPEEIVDMFVEAGFKLDDEVSKTPDGNSDVLLLTKKGAKLQLIDMHFHRTQGACWARNQIQQLYAGEKFTLQLDSHHRFAPNFDETLVEMIESVRTKETPKPLLTSYISSFDPENDPGARVQEPWKMDFDRFIPEGAVFFIPSTIDNFRELDKPIPGRFYSAHFAFADGSFAEEVQHDPEYFFHGEEIAISARAYTCGYDLFHPHRTVAWHEYTRKGRVKVWDDHTTAQKNKGRVGLDWVERNNLCHKRNRILFGMDGEDPKQIDFGKYGFGTTRTLRQYEEYAGISFEYRGVQQKTLEKKEPPPNNFPYASEEEWKKTFARSCDVRICVHKNELGELEEGDSFDFFYVGAHDAEGKELFRKDLNADEIARHLQHEWIDYRFIFLADRKPANYTIWVHTKNKEWGNKITREITEGV